MVIITNSDRSREYPDLQRRPKTRFWWRRSYCRPRSGCLPMSACDVVDGSHSTVTATRRPPAAWNRLPLVTRLRTFGGALWRSCTATSRGWPGARDVAL